MLRPNPNMGAAPALDDGKELATPAAATADANAAPAPAAPGGEFQMTPEAPPPEPSYDPAMFQAGFDPAAEIQRRLDESFPDDAEARADLLYAIATHRPR